MNENQNPIRYSDSISKEEFDTFLKASGEEQWKILLKHAEKNNKIIILRRKKQMEQEQTKNYEEISNQFSEFLHTKGIKAKFKVAFSNMAESARIQHETDKEKFEEVKRKSAEENKEFTEFLHTKGFKAKVKLVIENIKKGAKEAPLKTAKEINKISTKNMVVGSSSNYTAKELSKEFNDFLKDKGLDGKYVVEVLEEK